MIVIFRLYQKHFSRKKGYWIPLACIIQNQLIENSTNYITLYIGLNLDMMFQIKVLEDWSFDKYLSQFGKYLFSSKSKKVQISYCFFWLRRF